MKLGHEPDTIEHREQDARECPYLATGAASGGAILQRVLTIREQPILPNCTGESIAACVEMLTGSVASGVDLWREGLRRSGRTPSLDTGCAFVPALVGLAKRGWVHRAPDEWLRVPEAFQGPSLADELEAADRPGKVLARARIVATGGAKLDAIDDALTRGLGVVVGANVTSDYQYLSIAEGRQVIVGAALMGTKGEPHAQRIAGMVAFSGRRCYLVQNSWGTDWGGAWVDGWGWFPGCALVSAECILGAYDAHVIGLP